MLKTGDRVKSGKREGVLVGFQLKTQDLIVRDDSGRIQFFLATMTEKVENNKKKKSKKRTRRRA